MGNSELIMKGYRQKAFHCTDQGTEKQRAGPVRQKSRPGVGSAGINSWFGSALLTQCWVSCLGLRDVTLPRRAINNARSRGSLQIYTSNPIAPTHYPNTFNWFGAGTRSASRRVTTVHAGDRAGVGSLYRSFDAAPALGQLLLCLLWS